MHNKYWSLQGSEKYMSLYNGVFFSLGMEIAVQTITCLMENVLVSKHNNFSYFYFKWINHAVFWDSFYVSACPSGTYGLNCSQKYPQNHYGQFCIHKCSCNEDQYCNTVYGCSGII